MANQIKFNVGFQVDKTGLEEIKNSLRSIQNLTANDLMKLDKSLNLSAADAQLEKIKTTASEVGNALSRSFNSDLGTINVSKFNQELERINLKRIYNDFNSAGAAGQTAFRNITTQILTTNLQLKKSHSLLDEMATTMANTVKWGIASSVMNNFSSSVQKAYYYVKDLDGSLNDIRIVTEKSAESMQDFAKQANNAAQSLGASTLDYTEAALIYYQQGLSDEEVAARAETTLKAANVTGQSGEAVSEQLTAVWNGYKVSAQEAELYIDKLAAVAATTASDLEELSTGMSKVASAANLMGVDIDQLNAQLATIVSVTRQAPESVGTALKTIYARMGDIEAGIDSETTLGNYTQAMADMGFNVLNMNGELRDMGEIIEEIGGKWNTMSREQQIALSQTMAGTRQYNNLLSLFDNWDMYTEALNTSADAAGALQSQQDIFMESTEAHLQQMATAWEGVYDSLLDPETINGFADAMKTVATLLEGVIDLAGGGGNTFLMLGAIATKVFSKNIAQGLTTTAENFRNIKFNAEQARAEIELLGQLKQLPISDKILEQTIKYKEAIAKFGNLVSVEDRNQTNELINNIALLEAQEQQWNENKTAAEQYFQIAATRGEVENIDNISQLSDVEIQDNLLKLDDDIRLYTEASRAGREYAASLREIENRQNELNIDQLTEDMTQINYAFDYNTLLLDKNGKEYNELKTAIDKYNQAIQNGDNKQIIKASIELSEAYTRAGIAAEQAARNARRVVEQEAQGMSQRVRNEIEQNKRALEEFMKKINETNKFQIGVNVISSLGQIASSIQSIKNMGSIWNNEDLEFSDKLLQTLTTIGFTLPMLISSFNSFGKAVGATTTLTQTFAIVNKALSSSFGQQIGLLPTIISLFRGSYAVKAEDLLVERALTRAKYEGAISDTATVKSLTAKQRARILSTFATEAETAAVTEAKIAQDALNLSILKSPYLWIAGIMVGVVAVIAAVIKAKEEERKAQIEFNKEKLEEIKANQELIKSNQELADSYQDIIEAYKEGETSRENMLSSVEAICDAYDIEGGKILALTGRYKELEQAIKDSQEAELRKGVSNAKIGVELAQNNLRLAQENVPENTYDLSFGFNPFFDSKFLKAQEILMESGVLSPYGDIRGEDSFEFYENLQKALLTLQDANIPVSDLETELKEKIKSLTEPVEELRTQTDALAQSTGKLYALENNFNDIDSYSEYITARDELINKISKSLGMDAKEAAEYADQVMSEFSNVADFASNLDLKQAIAKDLVAFGNEEDLESALKFVEDELKNWSDEEIVTLYTHLDTALMMKDFDEFKERFDELIKAENKKGYAIKVQTILEEADETGAFTQEQIDSFYKNKDTQEVTGLSQKQFEGLDYETQKTIALDYYIETEKYAVAHKEAIVAELEAEYEAQSKIAASYEENTERYSRSLKSISEKIVDENGKQKYTYDELRETLINYYAALEAGEDTSAYKETIDDIKELETVSEDTMKMIAKHFTKVDVAENALTHLSEAIEEAKNAEYDYIKVSEAVQKTYDAINSAIDEIQGSYQTLDSVMNDYNKTGYMTMDNLQKLLDMDYRYLAALQFEDGQLKLNTETMKQMTLAQLDNARATAVEDAMNQLEALSTRDATDATYKQAIATAELTAKTLAAAEAARGSIDDWAAYWATMTNGIAAVNAAAAQDIGAALKVKLQTIDSVAANLDSNFSGIMGGSSSSSKTDKEGKWYKDEFDRYWEFKKYVDEVTEALEKLEKEQENLFGLELADHLRVENELLYQQADAYTKLAEEQRREAAELQEVLSATGVSFDEGGAIINYAQVTTNALADYNNAIQQYNAGAITETAFKVYEKTYEKFKENIERYDELYYNEMKETQENLEEIVRKQRANNLQFWEIILEVKLEKKELEREWNDFLKEINEDFKAVYKNLATELFVTMKNAGTYVGDTGSLTATLEAIRDVQKEIDAITSGKESGMFESLSQAQEKLKELNSELQDQATSLYDLYKAAWDAFMEGIDQSAEKFDELIEKFELIDDELEYQRELIELLYGPEAYGLMSKLYEAQEANAKIQLDSLRQQAEMWKNLYENAEEGSEEQQKYYESWIEAQTNLNDLVVEYIDLLKNEYSNTIESIFKQLETSITGSSFDEIENEWEYLQEQSDRYLDNIEGLYSIQSLAGKINTSIAEQTSIKNQQKLQDLYDKEIGYLREKENLTQYDLDMAEARYNVALKEIALEEARANKTSMRLVRGTDGNWSYQYTADEDNIAEKQQELSDGYYKLYELSQDAYEENLENIQDLNKKYLEAMKEIALNEYLTEEEKEAKMQILRERYLAEYERLATQNQTIRSNLAIAATAVIMGEYAKDEEAYYSMTENEKALMDSLKTYNISSYAELETAVLNNYDNIQTKANIAMGQISEYWNSAAQNIANAWNSDNGESVKTLIIDVYNNCINATEIYKSKVDELAGIVKQSFNNESGIVASIGNAQTATQNLVNETQNLVNTTQSQLGEYKNVVDMLGDSWDGVKDSISGAVLSIQQYLQLMAQAAATPQINHNPVAGFGTPGSATNTNSGTNPNGTPTTKTPQTYWVWKESAGQDYGGEYLYHGFIQLPTNEVISTLEEGPIDGNGVEAWIYKKLMELGYTGSRIYLQGFGSSSVSFDTGGYTGDWSGENGRIAMLHQKELVLNAEDTENILSAVGIMRQVMAGINSNIAAQMFGLNNLNPNSHISSNVSNTNNSNQQNVYNINASFPNADDVGSIREAILGLPNLISQRMNNNKK